MGFFRRPKVTVLPEPEEPDLGEVEEKRQESFTRFLQQQRTLGPAQLSAQSPGLRFGLKMKKGQPFG